MIPFTSTLPAEEIARFLAPLVYDTDPSPGVPFLQDGRWELSRENDHKLCEDAPGQYRYIDRYQNPERMQRIRAALDGWEHATLGGAS